MRMTTKTFDELSHYDLVYIRRPWWDKDHPNGILEKAHVLKKIKHDNLCVVEGLYGVFHRDSMSASFNEVLQEPTLEIQAEYIVQRINELPEDVREVVKRKLYE